VLSFAIAIGAAFFITQLVVDNIQQRFEKQLYEAGKIASEMVVKEESKLLESMRLIGNVKGVSEALRAGDPDTLRSLTLGIAANNQVEALDFIDLRGNDILSIRHKNGSSVEEYDFATGGQTGISDFDITQKVLQGISDAAGDKFADLVKVENEEYLFISGPVYDQDRRLVGAILVGKTLPSLLGELRAATFAQITIYDYNGQVVHSTLPFPLDVDELTAFNVVPYKDISSTVRDLNNRRSFASTSIPYSEILGTFELRRNKNLGVLGAALSQNMLVQTSTTSRWQIFLLVAAANLLVIFVGINLATLITRPLLQLVQASRKVSAGDLSVAVEPQSNDEITVLTESFNAMVASLNKSQQDLIKSYDETLEGWAVALELRDKETEGHSKRVTDLSVQLAQAMGMQGKALVSLRRGALLHDIGKMGTPDAILRKEGSLTEEERRVIQRHPTDAYNMLSPIDYLQEAMEIPFCHHEKWDGSGYPRGLAGQAIPLSARIFSLVDVWDALTNDRPYRKAMTLEQAVRIVLAERGKSFDPAVVDVFLRKMGFHGG
jgi:putative nucleotidyltransferase with HDIG domain